MIKISNGPSKISYDRFVFSGGEVQVKLDEYAGRFSPGFYNLTAHLTNSNDIFELALVTDALRRRHGKSLELHLTLPYVPYARQDRAMTSGESLALKVFADFLNSLKFDSIEVWDVHSDVSLALIDRSVNKPVEDLFDTRIVTEAVRGATLVSPDAGSLKKVNRVALRFGRPVIQASKNRSVLTGAITDTVVYSENIGDTSVLIVDDICDGGRTFIELAKELRDLTTGKINLYVTHGIFSKGLDVLFEHIDTVYCALPFPNVERSNPRLVVLNG